MEQAATPPYGQSHHIWLLEELLWCLRCGRQMHPAPRADGTRFYSCGPDCDQPDVLATRLERDLLLPALVRAYAVLHGVGRRVETTAAVGPTAVDKAEDAVLAGALSFAGATPWRLDGELTAPPRERATWLRCDFADHRAVILTAYVRVTVEAEGAIQPFWRHAEETANPATGATTR